MTVIEFFDKNAIENVISSLLCNPDKVVFIGYNRNAMKKAINKYNSIAIEHGKTIDFSAYSIARNNLQQIINIITRVLEENGEITIDLTGGEDLYLVASGMVYSNNPEKVQLHRFNVDNGKLYDCDADGNVISISAYTITIEENIEIYGGRVVYDNEIPIGTHKWDFTNDFRKDIEAMWKICCKNPGNWNSTMTCFDMNGAQNDVENNDVLVDKTKKIFDTIPSIFRDLIKYGLVKDVKIKNGVLNFQCKNEQIKRCLTKAGQLLELKTTNMLLTLNEEANGELFDDVLTGVTIYWDESNENQSNVVNEIDVVVMKGLVPIFISCKNGFVDVNELYKLNTVAEHFGGEYARKVLIATEDVTSISNRAEEMKIKVIDNIGQLDFNEKELKRKIKSLFN